MWRDEKVKSNLARSDSSLGTISRCLKTRRSFKQICKHKQAGNVPEMEAFWCEMCKWTPKQKQKDFREMLFEDGKRLSFSTAEQVIYQNGVKGHWLLKKPRLQTKTVLGVNWRLSKLRTPEELYKWRWWHRAFAASKSTTLQKKKKKVKQYRFGTLLILHLYLNLAETWIQLGVGGGCQ